MDLFIQNTTILQVFNIFFVYSFLGWVFESIYCTIVEGKWKNRGFLLGPVCPIYGAGAVTISYIYHIFPDMKWGHIIIVSFFGSIILEVGTSVVLEKAFHARWWDYSNLPSNISGRISLFTSMGFGIAGVFVIYVANRGVGKFLRIMPDMLIEPIAILFIIMISVDATLTISSLTNFYQVVTGAQKTFNTRMELIVSYPKQSLANTKRIIAERQVIFPLFGKSAVNRVKSFRYHGVTKDRISFLINKIQRKKVK